MSNKNSSHLLEQLNLLGKENNFDIKINERDTQNINFFDEEDNELLCNIKKSDAIIHTILKNYPDLDDQVVIDLGEIIKPYYQIIGLKYNFEDMMWNENYKFGMKKYFTLATDIDYYQVTFKDNKDFANTLIFAIKLYTEPMKAFYKTREEQLGQFTVSYVELGVYYKDLDAIIKPMLSVYKNKVSNLLSYKVDVIDDNIIQLIDMLKIA